MKTDAQAALEVKRAELIQARAHILDLLTVIDRACDMLDELVQTRDVALASQISHMLMRTAAPVLNASWSE